MAAQLFTRDGELEVAIGKESHDERRKLEYHIEQSLI